MQQITRGTDCASFKSSLGLNNGKVIGVRLEPAILRLAYMHSNKMS